MSTPRIDTGRTGPIQPQTDIQETEHLERAEQSTTTDTATISASDKQAAASNANAKAAENQITGQILASQLQAQAPAAAPKVPSQGKILVENPNVKDPAVLDFQKEINEFRKSKGQAPIKEDGFFGKETKAAVKEFQQASGLKDDGIVGDNTRSRLRLENSPSFQGLNSDTKDQVRGMMNGFQKDPTNRQLLTTIGLDENFAKLSRAEQQVALTDLKGTASSLTLKTMKGMNNDELLKIGQQPGGQERLEGMKFALKQGPVTPESIKELDRLNSATFKEGPGLVLKGTPEDKEAYRNLVRREMLTSPSFAKTMNEINNDATRRPTIVNIGRDMPGIPLDTDQKGIQQNIDLNDFDKLPRTPPADNPHAITQGQVLSHAMREARERVKGAKDHDEAHKLAIIAENEYRKDIGQTSTRKVPPDKDETRIEKDNGELTLIIHFDGAPDERLEFDDQQRLKR